MQIAMVQMNVESGNCEHNFNTIKKYVEQAKEEHMDLIIFPEMCVSGYLLQDQFLDSSFCEEVASYNDKIKELSQGIGIIFGNLYHSPIGNITQGRDGRPLRLNACFFAYNKEWVKKENGYLDGIYIKHLNPDYRIFDDSRYFLSGIEISNALFKSMNALISPFIFKHANKTYRIGLQVCEDLWSFDYQVDVTNVYANQNVDFIVNVSSSPYTLHKEISRDKQIKKHATLLGEKMPFVIYLNACGMQNTGKNVVMFDGDSRVYDKQGEVMFSMNDAFCEEYAQFHFEKHKQAKRCEHKLLQALTKAIYEFDRQIFSFHPKWIIGLSGGIDSCVNAALLVKALGNKRVIAYNMASKYNSQTTKNNARLVSDALKIELREGSIEEVTQATLTTLRAYDYKAPYASLVEENIQARVRGHLLSTFASLENGVIVNNANKIEAALGYCTLYGDSIGAISPIGDLTKVQVFKLAKELNEDFKKEVIPTTLLPEIVGLQIKWEMPPSAELKENQLDPMKWFYHDYIIQKLLEYPTGSIEELMEAYLDGSIYKEEIGKWIHYYGLQNPKAFIEDLEWLLKTYHNAVFKRIQMPPNIVISRGAFGSDFRESQFAHIRTSSYEILKNKILSS